ncbi:MAG: hypothetical protein AAFQ42_08895, partial [Pseudomonadota bacterium]
YSFAEHHAVEPHNAYLYSFIIAGWLGGVAFIVLIGATLAVGLRIATTDNPFRLAAVTLFSTFLALSVQSLIVDTDHWRHLYVVAAAIWGIWAWLRRPEASARGDADDKRPHGAGRLYVRSPRALAEKKKKRTAGDGAALSAIDIAFEPTATASKRQTWRRRLGRRKQRPFTLTAGRKNDDQAHHDAPKDGPNQLTSRPRQLPATTPPSPVPSAPSWKLAPDQPSTPDRDAFGQRALPATDEPCFGRRATPPGRPLRAPATL